MMQSELQARIGESVTPNQYAVIERVYAYHPSIPEVHGKAVIADIWRRGGFYAITQMLSEANDAAAKENGAEPVKDIRDDTFEFYEVKDGLCINPQPKPLKHVFEYVQNCIADWDKEHPEMNGLIDEYFHYDGLDQYENEATVMWMYPRWIACYAVNGDSEGHYIHVDAIKGESRQLLFLGKTFRGMEHAQLIASLLAKWLHA